MASASVAFLQPTAAARQYTRSDHPKQVHGNFAGLCSLQRAKPTHRLNVVPQFLAGLASFGGIALAGRQRRSMQRTRLSRKAVAAAGELQGSRPSKLARAFAWVFRGTLFLVTLALLLLLGTKSSALFDSLLSQLLALQPPRFLALAIGFLLVRKFAFSRLFRPWRTEVGSFSEAALAAGLRLLPPSLSTRSTSALSTIGSLAFGQASKNLVGNLTAGVIINLTRGFGEGEEIESKSKKIQGVIDKVGAVYTTINQADGTPILIPNESLLNDPIVKCSAKAFQKIETDLSVQLPDVRLLREFIQEANTKLAAHPSVLSQEEVESIQRSRGGKLQIHRPMVNYKGSAGKGVKLFLRAYVRGEMSYEEFCEVQSSVLLSMNDLILSYGGTL